MIHLPLRIASAIANRILDALLGPDELAGLDWPSTTPTEER